MFYKKYSFEKEILLKFNKLIDELKFTGEINHVFGFDNFHYVYYLKDEVVKKLRKELLPFKIKIPLGFRYTDSIYFHFRKKIYKYNIKENIFNTLDI
jgi:hypothetical protein